MFVKSGLFHLWHLVFVTSGQVESVTFAQTSAQGIAFSYGQLLESYIVMLRDRFPIALYTECAVAACSLTSRIKSQELTVSKLVLHYSHFTPNIIVTGCGKLQLCSADGRPVDREACFFL